MNALGIGCALLAPCAWSVAIILYKRTQASPLAMNLFKNTLALFLFTVTLLVLRVGLPHDRSLADWLQLAISGVLGLALADNLLFEGLKKIGAARLALVDTIYAPLVVLLSWAILAERPGMAFVVGAIGVVAGIGIATIERGAFQAVDREVWVGMGLAASGISCTAIGVVVAKPILEVSDLFEVTWTRMLAGVAVQVAFIAVSGRWREATASFRPSADWKNLVPAALIGTYLSLLLWLAGFKWADASVAAVLNQMGTIYMLILARLVLSENLRPAQVAGSVLAAGGALVIVLSRV